MIAVEERHPPGRRDRPGNHSNLPIAGPSIPCRTRPSSATPAHTQPWRGTGRSQRFWPANRALMSECGSSDSNCEADSGSLYWNSSAASAGSAFGKMKVR
jgi:hypothetical protein